MEELNTPSSEAASEEIEEWADAEDVAEEEQPEEEPLAEDEEAEEAAEDEAEEAEEADDAADEDAENEEAAEDEEQLSVNFVAFRKLVETQRLTNILRQHLMQPEIRDRGRVFALLNLKDGLTMKEMAQVLGMHVPSLNKVLEKYEREELITLTGEGEDKGSVVVSLTEAGAQVKVPNENMTESLFTGFTEEEIGAFADSLKRIIANIEAEAGKSAKALLEEERELRKAAADSFDGKKSDRGGRGFDKRGGDRGGRGGFDKRGGDRGGRGGDRGGRGGDRGGFNRGGDRGGRGGFGHGDDRGGRDGFKRGGDRGGRGGFGHGDDRGGRDGFKRGGDRGGFKRNDDRRGGDRGGFNRGGDRGGRGGFKRDNDRW